MLLKWILAFGWRSTAFVTVVPAAVGAQILQHSPAPVPNHTPPRPKEVLGADRLALLDSGFRSMYELDFSGARQQFIQYERENPDDPIGPAAEGAELLFSEFSRLGILQSQMFIKDPNLVATSKLVPDPAVLGRFYLAIQRTSALAERQLFANHDNPDALLASAFAAGLQAECMALVQNRTLAAAQYVRKATAYAERLFSVCRNCYEVYVATGLGQYVIGSRKTPVRWILRARGLFGRKREEIKELRIAAQHAHYLAPFAEILLTMAYLRDKKPQMARLLLADLGCFPRKHRSPNPVGGCHVSNE